VFWSKDLLVFEATGAGSRIDVPLDVPEDGTYEVIAQMGLSPDYGVYTVLLDGKPTGETTELEHEPGANAGTSGAIDSYYLETYVGEDRLLGWRTLSQGRHTVSFICTGKNASSSNYLLGLDTFVLSRVASADHPGRNTASSDDRADAIRRVGSRDASAADLKSLIDALSAPGEEVREAAAWSLTQAGTAAAPAVPALTRAMGDADPIVRGLAALALRDAGSTAAAPALDTLIAHLSDADENVRMMSAQAIAIHGPRAAPAIAALIAIAQTPGQHPHVLRSVADALGLIGAAAREALPALRELQKIPRVRWAADLAIKRIGTP
jgi:hypothetical protein